jgi:hypothetical protein
MKFRIWTQERVDFLKVHGASLTNEEVAAIMTVATGHKITAQAVKFARYKFGVKPYR